MSKAAGTGLGVAMILIGALWAGQGLNLIGGSFMTGQGRWVAIGAVVALAGAAMVAWANHGGRPSS